MAIFNINLMKSAKKYPQTHNFHQKFHNHEGTKMCLKVMDWPRPPPPPPYGRGGVGIQYESSVLEQIPMGGYIISTFA